MKNAPDLPYLLRGYMAGSLSDEEKLALLNFLENKENEKQWNDLIGEVYGMSTGVPADYQEDDVEQMIENILQYPRASATPVRRIAGRWWKYAAAAAALILLSVTGYFLWNNSKKELPIAKQTVHKNDIMPGGNHAVLTLSNGAQVVLDSVGQGSLGIQGGSRVTKVNAGSLVYKTAASYEPSNPLYNSISTPAGGQYQVTLADGTQVWLNALSSLKFPTSFNGPARTVEVTGEAYFEVAKNIAKPFIVHVHNAAIEVFGTHFNVMAYDNENALETTLLEGSIKFTKGDKHVLLKPGQQTRLLSDAQIQLVNNVNVDQVIAWKNGMQSFNSADIRTIMRQVERWYDIHVEYRGNITTRKFAGDIPRDAKLSELLTVLKVNKIHFEIDAEHKKMIIMP